MWYDKHEDNQQLALVDQNRAITYAQLATEVTLRAHWLKAQGVQRLGLLMDNQIEWALFDLACQQADVCCIPIPIFFTEQQLAHLKQVSGLEMVLFDGTKIISAETHTETPFKGVFADLIFTDQTPVMPKGTCKITFTSGSTGQPKGVCLDTHTQLQVARSIVDRIGLHCVKHLCLLPLATLLENIAGIYAPLMVGGSVYLASEQERGFTGSRLTHPQAMLKLIQEQQPNTLILVPELLSFLLLATRQGWQPPASLQFIAVGGGKVSASLMTQARAMGLPVYQGYGLSECASVVSLNSPECDAIQTAGKLLPHTQAYVDHGELVITENLFLGYLNQPDSFYPTEFRTGDLVSLEQDVITVKGRSKNLIINSFGRNISPEWVESELMATQCFRHVLVFGEAQPFCGALLVLNQPDMTQQAIQQIINQVNAGLPDYAQVKDWLLALTPFEQSPDFLTNTGKLVRANILAHFEDRIQTLYDMNACANY